MTMAAPVVEMPRKISHLPTLRGMELLDSPLLNKGTAFTDEERSSLGLHGLLPIRVETLEEQVTRAYEAFRRKTDDLERHIYLRALQDTNEVLFYRLVLSHLEEMMPIVYTPVVGQACQEFCHIYRRPRGLFIPYPLKDAIPRLLRHRPNPEVDAIVVTDGERILGIGDQGAGGLGIPIGKLSLYTLIGGIAPERTLPIILDVGTNNPKLLNDPEYLGWHHERITGTEYYNFVEQFVRAVETELPHVLLQWEDFAVVHARTILDEYRDRLLTFNDDIQGTASVALGAILSALHVSGQGIADQTIVILGAGSAGVGVADYLKDAMVSAGLTEAQARDRIYLVNTKGLLHSKRTDLRAEQQVYVQAWEKIASWANPETKTVGLADVLDHVRATVLIGLSTLGGAFNEKLVRGMAKKVARPIIFPLSNPTVKAEAVPADLLEWSDGKALIATGSPFAPVLFRGRTIPIAQCNNVYVFPAVGLGLVASRARRVTDSMLHAAARELARRSPAAKDPEAPLLPRVADIRDVAIEIAVAVGQEAQNLRLAPRTTAEELRRRVVATQWTPTYPEYQVG
jgi:malate dehydrogenase (oxaloacetate-decarboxylating)